MSAPKPRVRAVNCHHHADDQEVYAALRRATDPLEAAWEKLRAAKRIGIKFNQDWRPGQVVMFQGQRQQLVSDKVTRATLRLLREKTDADLICADASVYRDERPENTTTIMPLLREFEVQYVDANAQPLRAYPVPGGGQMFRQYVLSQRAVETDAFVSVQKLKNHKFMGVTLCLKNLFGLTPLEPGGHPRGYFHHLVRMPYMLADLGRIFDPALSIIDGLVSQAGQEWGDGPPRITNALIAGDQVIATDACTAHLMGHDPVADWLTPPFHRDRNALVVAAEGGFGTVDLEEVDFQSELSAPLAEFFAIETDDQSTVVSWRRTTAEQALYYLERRKGFLSQHAGEYILLQQGEVRWHSESGRLDVSRRKLARRNKLQGMWLKYVDPAEAEGEHYHVYEGVLAKMADLAV
jgi:uncharacterized protein (DUF362 family)